MYLVKHQGLQEGLVRHCFLGILAVNCSVAGVRDTSTPGMNHVCP